MDDTIKVGANHYKSLLKSYIESQDESALYHAEQMSKQHIKDNVLPDEIINMHNQALAELYPDLGLDIKHSMDFLLETMIAYGLAHQEFQTLKEEQLELKSEISVAANVQKTLLSTTKPDIEGLDIGVISVPSGQMNGDYYHFVKGRAGSLKVAIADVIGKGIPAALCMSMIKYSMDSIPKPFMHPNAVLENLNGVVEQNVEPNMFITMFYGKYIPHENILRYASAGHEPGFHYVAAEDTFNEIESAGLVLGVLPETTYKQYELKIDIGDMIILLTDGVTECRQGNRFIEREEVLNVIRQYEHLSAQELVESVYKYFERLQNFELKDDFTLIVLRKEH